MCDPARVRREEVGRDLLWQRRRATLRPRPGRLELRCCCNTLPTARMLWTVLAGLRSFGKRTVKGFRDRSPPSAQAPRGVLKNGTAADEGAPRCGTRRE